MNLTNCVLATKGICDLFGALGKSLGLQTCPSRYREPSESTQFWTVLASVIPIQSHHCSPWVDSAQRPGQPGQLWMTCKQELELKAGRTRDSFVTLYAIRAGLLGPSLVTGPLR